MTKTTLNRLLAAFALIIAAAQAWDAGALDAAPGIRALIAAAVALPAIGILASESFGIRLGVVALAGLILFVCRMLSAVTLPGLGLAAAFPGILILLVHLRVLTRASGEPAQ